MRLLAVPRAVLAQPADELVEGDEVAGHGPGQRRDPDRRQVVRHDGPVEVVPVDGLDPLVGQAEMVEDGGRRRRLVGREAVDVDGELDRGEHVGRPALGDEQRAALAGRLSLELGPVDQPDAGRDRVDAEPRPGEVEEGEGRDDRDVHPRVGPQQLDGALGDQWRAGHAVDDGFALSGRAAAAAMTRSSTMRA